MCIPLKRLILKTEGVVPCKLFLIELDPLSALRAEKYVDNLFLIISFNNLFEMEHCIVCSKMSEKLVNIEFTQLFKKLKKS